MRRAYILTVASRAATLRRMHDGGLRVTSNWTIPLREIELTFARAGGPGGQNVNKVASKVQLRIMLTEALQRPKRRVPTKPSAAARERRLTAKKKHGALKRERTRSTD